MPTWGTLIGLGFRRWSAYRMAAFAGAFTNSVFGLIRAAVVTATVGVAGGVLAGYDARGVATYVWLGQALIGPVHLGAWNDLAQRIRTGDIAVDLARPVDPMLVYLAADLGRAAFVFLPRGLPPLAVGALVTGLSLPATPLPYLLGLVSVALAVGVSFGCRWLLSLSAFWLLDLRGPTTLYLVLTAVLTGLAVPVHWFPPWLATLAAATPFPAMLQAPIDILSGRVAGGAAVAGLAVQAAWLAGLLTAGSLIFRLGARRLVVQGG
ncbi:ABC-2 family transporter protein [Dactylosporangium sp. AC04546]|uniref:ABC transporter permease n=1 Tax=Dactylosporangium sp. AC04546 TaxID=2862460 RepID=UPI001EDCC758|nr:ABC-2 family transporter protein [Dactylosporangium sp. AC04546]WVK81877.1 ABC-2 family transporter protein [Dactylosporangium sp. AC04546]